MPNHWHLVAHPNQDGDLSKFMGWLSNTHTRRWHAIKNTIGEGHLYQGRYKSFLCQQDRYFISLVKYVERNAKKANLCSFAQDWKWSSLYKRENGTMEQRKIFSEWPIAIPENYLQLVNEGQNVSEERMIENSIIKNNPYGDNEWIKKTVKKFGLEQTLRGVGRPKKSD
jgi:putative transposase